MSRRIKLGGNLQDHLPLRDLQTGKRPHVEPGRWQRVRSEAATPWPGGYQFCHPHDAPSIQPKDLSYPEDLRVAADATRPTRCIVSAPALYAFKSVEYLTGDRLQTEEELHDAAAQSRITAFHPVGRRRMGNDAATARQC